MADDETVEQTEGETVAPEQEEIELTDLEKVAMETGWRPKDQWSGEDDAWQPADAYLRETHKIARSTSKKIKDLEKQFAGVGQANQAMIDRAVKAERERIEAELERATDEGDTAAVKKAANELSELNAQPRQTTQSTEVAKFMERNADWFNTDREATDWASNRSVELAQQGLSEARQLQVIERELKTVFPELAKDKPQAKTPAAVNTPARTVKAAPRTKGYATLPPEARKAADDFASRNANRFDGKTKEQVRDMWAKDFYSEEANNG